MYDDLFEDLQLLAAANNNNNNAANVISNNNNEDPIKDRVQQRQSCTGKRLIYH
jgi:hypothetical protein